jgi:hypothetical protein
MRRKYMRHSRTKASVVPVNSTVGMMVCGDV